VVEVESLMFNHLMQPRQAVESQQTTLLVVGDFFVDQNVNLISLLAGALKIQPTPLNIVFKPHPMNHTIPDLSSLPHAKISDELLGDILPKVHTAVTCNGSTAALECFACGVNTISVLDPEILNSSPLRSVDGASFVSSVSQLAKAIAQNSSRTTPTTPLVILDPSLPRWNGLIQ
jgi:surface carbohydrate biosynthesis protein (TIGR04326 family)